ncbi:MAG TPA: hypothetical protein VE783_12720 [Candidatus Limnocylindrales bacterium]|jgi:hypothetical protein|nr:hypothetical protein [Candidatus Limnocylindrales bacterium]
MIMMLQLSHFSAAFIFAFFSSIVFGICFRNHPRDMVRYGGYCFAVFMGGMIVAGWLMWLIKH